MRQGGNLLQQEGTVPLVKMKLKKIKLERLRLHSCDYENTHTRAFSTERTLTMTLLMSC